MECKITKTETKEIDTVGITQLLNAGIRLFESTEDLLKPAKMCLEQMEVQGETISMEYKNLKTAYEGFCAVIHGI